MVEVSRDGRRIYFTNSLYTPWDRQFYPDGIQGWMAKVNVPPGGGAMQLDREVLPRDRRHAAAPGPPGRRRRVVRFVLLRVNRIERIIMDWQAMLFLGAYHGINPGMGWLFAVALGMQQGSVRGVWRALPPIALGHAAVRRRGRAGRGAGGPRGPAATR